MKGSLIPSRIAVLAVPMNFIRKSGLPFVLALVPHSDFPTSGMAGPYSTNPPSAFGLQPPVVHELVLSFLLRFMDLILSTRPTCAPQRMFADLEERYIQKGEVSTAHEARLQKLCATLDNFANEGTELRAANTILFFERDSARQSVSASPTALLNWNLTFELHM